MKIRPNAPRFHALWQSREGKTILLMRRSDWEKLKTSDVPVLLTVERASDMPFRDLVHSDAFRAAIAKREVAWRVRISVYRYDPSDDPTPINVDDYLVLESFPPTLDVWGMIDTATTDPGPNFQHYRDDHVFLIKERPENHWLTELPSEVVALLERPWTTLNSGVTQVTRAGIP